MAEKAKRAFRDPNTIIAMIAVLLVGVLCQSSGAENPALAYIAEEFNQLEFSSIAFVTTVPSLMMIPASLIYSFCRKKGVSFRILFVIASILLIVGGVLPGFTPHDPNAFGFIIGWRAVFGLGVGVMWPLAQSLIVELYSGQRQNTMLGFNSVVTSVGGIIWANIGGNLALMGWRFSFFTYFIPIAVLVFCAIFLPNHRKNVAAAAADGEGLVAEKPVEDELDTAPVKGYVGMAVILIVLYFVYNFCNMTYFTNISMKVVGEGIGDSATAGLGQSMFTVGSLIIGVIFGKVMNNKFMARYSMGLGWILTGIGMVIVAQAPNFTMVAIGSVIQGFGTGMFMPTMVGLIGNVGGKKNASFILGISTCVLGASQFFGPTIFNMIVESMGLTAGGPCMLLAAIVHIVFAIITFIWLAIKGKDLHVA